MKSNKIVMTVLGSAGGVAKSVLSILNKSVVDTNDPIHSLIKNSVIHLIDLNQKEIDYYSSRFPQLYPHFILHEFDLKDTKKLTKHLKNTKTAVVIDTSWADTVEMLQCCNKLGVKYVNTALENTFIDENEELFEGFQLAERISHLEKHKDLFTNTTAIIGSGMNPGVVQWMAYELLKDSKEKPLACYIVEHDTSFFKNPLIAKENTIYTTWSPECFLDEAIASYPMYFQHHTPLYLYEDVYDIEFKVNLGKKQFYGCLMPHEEIFTLGKIYDVESGFLYKVNDHTTDLIRSNLDDVDKLWDYDMEVLDPQTAPLDGEDLVGVLVVYPEKEHYMYNVSSNEEIFSKFQTNATYFQVACGVYAALSVLLKDSIPKGAYYVDELLHKTKNQYGKYLTHYMTTFVTGKNKHTDGLLLQRMRRFNS
ncbi:saccharopine dehydrogenase NADP-binding domain-containing protein [Niallia endozanthoxylica]|uniref:S-adenosylmethionine decarboxylase related protein n=1 Tax=Niallia endozanthoxylica TaxID=2036016 RepID=A0A5J5HZA2_9BACI|nr:saccharopine dehydrogenase NADP-binding domain-containing protein [Niallia endozanthoxylica]KAA9028471.1 S-adenosylmethionine decarboxylase related protein [Niallia endozanthoxylica]